MRIGVPREIKDGERRVGAVPAGVRALVDDGHEGLVECGAGALGPDRGGAGVLLTGVEGVARARVVVVGAGTAGGAAARVAAQLGCRVTVLSRGGQRLTALAAALAQAGIPVVAQTLDEIG